MAVPIEELIDKIEMYVLQRQIGIAEILAREFLDDKSSSPLKESGYAILAIVMAYFEMIEQFAVGRESKPGDSGPFFLAGFRKVYPQTTLAQTDIKLICDWVRNKMYHCGMVHRGIAKYSTTRMAVHLSRFFAEGFAVRGGELHINPGKAVAEIQAHFLDYVKRLRNPSCVAERTTFEAYCVSMGVGAPVPNTVLTSTVTSTGISSTTTRTRTTGAAWEPG